MKYSFLILILVFSMLKSQSQDVDSLTAETNFPDSVIANKLVELATSSPAVDLKDNQNKILEYQLKSAKDSWLNLLSLSLNYNSLNLPTQSGVDNTIYPRYFFGFNIPLGTVFSRTQVKAGRERLKMNENEMMLLKATLKAEVLKRYNEYKTYNALILLQTNATDNDETLFLQANEKFKEGLISLEAYSQFEKNYFDQKIKAKNLELQKVQVKLEIERIIGTTMENMYSMISAELGIKK